MSSPIAFSAAGTGTTTGAGGGTSGGGVRPKLEHAYLELRTPPPAARSPRVRRAAGSTSSSTRRS